MSDTQRSIIIRGGGTALFSATALLTATVFAGPAAPTITNVIAGSAAAVQLCLAFVCAGLLAKTAARHLLTVTWKRIEKQLSSASAEQLTANEVLLAQIDGRQKGLVEAIATGEERLGGALAEIDRATGALTEAGAERDRIAAGLANDVAEQSKAAGSLARSLKLQTEAITLIRKQTRAIFDGLEGRPAEGPDTLAHATEGQDVSRKLMNLVRNGHRETQAQLKPIAPALRELEKKSKELEVGQRRVMNFLRKEGNIQVVLGNLVAAERRLVSSVEAGALTNSDSLSAATAQSIGEVREDLEALHREVRELSSRADQFGADVGAAAPRMGEVAAELDHLRGEFVALREESGASSSATQDNVTQVLEKLEVLSIGLDTAFIGTDGAPAAHGVDGDHGKESLASVRETLDGVLRLTEKTRTDVKTIGPRIDRNGIDVVRQVEALIQLLGRVDTSRHRYPASGGWAMTPDSLLLLSDLIRERKPRRIVELGSGSSTVWVGSFAKGVGATLHSFEHLEEYRKSTELALENFGLERTVDLRLAVLTEIQLDGKKRNWYEPQAFEDLKDIDMLIVDGPPQSTGPEPRHPAFQMLCDKLAPGALVVVDDLHRGQETEMVETWIEQNPSLTWTPWAAGRTGVLEYGGI